MKSYEVLREVSQKLGAKHLAAELKISPKLFQKWTQPVGPAHDGRMNPVERVVQITRLADDRRLVEWLCAAAGGFFVPNVAASLAKEERLPAMMDLPQAENALVHDIATFELALTEAIPQPKSRARVEALRGCFEALKSNGERLVRSLEAGVMRLAAMGGYCFWDVVTPGGLI